MNKLVVDGPLIGAFERAIGGAELRAPDGRVLGFFIPKEAYNALIYSWAREEFRREEEDELSLGISRDHNREGGIATSELLAHLQELRGAAKQPS